jgi:serine/threonine protein kinase
MTAHGYRNALPPGYNLLWYRMEDVLGQGGFGITYLAWDGNLKIWVAIKEYLPADLAVRGTDHLLHPVADDRSSLYQWGLQRFLEEAQTLAQFSHKNIVQVYTVFKANNTAYMVMRYEEGESLAAKLRDPQFCDNVTEATLLKLLFPLLDGLAAVHAVNLIHRDIKPGNIFIRKDNSPVLLDFGSARQVVGGQTRSLTTLVTPGYAPFEQYSNEADKQGPWSDIYALGATLYTAATARTPIEAVTRAQELFGRKRDPMEPAAAVGNGRFSSRFLQAVDQALRFRPADRPQTVAAWKGLFPQPRLQTPAQRKWLAAGGVFAALALTGLAAMYTFPGWQEFNPELFSQQLAPEKPIIELPNQRLNDLPTPPLAEPRRLPTARARIPGKQPAAPPNEATEQPQRPPTKASEGETELAAVREPEVTELPPSADKAMVDNANQLAMAEPRTGNEPTADALQQLRRSANPPADTVPSGPKPFESPIKPAAPAPLQVQPAVNTVAVAACQSQEFSVIGDGVQAPYHWWVDGKRQSQTGTRFTFSQKTPGAHEIRVATATEQGSSNHRWQVTVNVPSVTQTEVEQWLSGVQRALEQRDVAKLKQLGYVHSEPEAADLLKKLQARQKLQVVLQNVRAELAGDRALLSFEQVDRWYDPKSYSMVVDYSSHQATLVRKGCASLIAAR